MRYTVCEIDGITYCVRYEVESDGNIEWIEVAMPAGILPWQDESRGDRLVEKAGSFKCYWQTPEGVLDERLAEALMVVAWVN